VIVVAQMSGCLPRLGRPVRLLGQRPRVRCPVSGVRARDVHASGVQCPGVDVRRPASVSARPASAVSAPGDFVERVGAAGQPHGQERPGSGRPAVSANGSTIWLSQSGVLVRTVWRRIGRVAQVGGGDYAPWPSWEAQGRVASSLRAFPAGLRLAVSAARSTLATL
jgi:hypothetical protein